MGADRAWFRGEGGGLHVFDLPLSPLYAEQHRKGVLVEVPAPGGERTEAAAVDTDGQPDGPERPAKSASKAAWVDYAVATGMDRATAQAMTRDDLVEHFAG